MEKARQKKDEKEGDRKKGTNEEAWKECGIRRERKQGKKEERRKRNILENIAKERIKKNARKEETKKHPKKNKRGNEKKFERKGKKRDKAERTELGERKRWRSKERMKRCLKITLAYWRAHACTDTHGSARVIMSILSHWLYLILNAASSLISETNGKLQRHSRRIRKRQETVRANIKCE